MISETNLRTSYPTKPLGELVEFLDHLRKPVTASEREPGPFPYYGANGQQDSVAGYLFDEPLILVAEDGGFFGDPQKTIAYRVTGKCWVNNHAHVLRPVPNVDIGYLCRHLEQYDVRPFTSGTTRLKLNKSQAQRIPIALPPLPIQKKIAAILDAADALRAKRRESIEQLDSLVQATFLEMFGDPVTNPMGWEPCTLGVMCDIQTGFAWKAAKFNTDGVGTPVIRIQNVGTSDVELIHTQEPPISRFWVSPSELLLTLSGSFRLAKWSGPKAMLNQRIARLTVKAGINKSFLEHALAARLQAIEAMGRHSLVNNVALADLRVMVMTLPPLDLQARFASIVESIEQQKSRLMAHLAELDTLFASLQSRAFNGELVA